MFKWEKAKMFFINLDHRADRLIRMETELIRVGLAAERMHGIYTRNYSDNDPRYQVMRFRTPGAIGCYQSQLKCMRRALLENKSVWICEDDAHFASDIHDRLNHIESFLNRQDSWDIFWLGGTFHKNPTWHATGHPNPEISGICNCSLNKDFEPTDDPKIIKTYGIWSTYCYIVNIDSLEKIINLLEENVHLSIGIDWEMILLQPQLKTFAFIPGCVKQYDSISDIGQGVTRFSGFSFLGDYWFQDTMDNFNYENFYK